MKLFSANYSLYVWPDDNAFPEARVSIPKGTLLVAKAFKPHLHSLIASNRTLVVVAEGPHKGYGRIADPRELRALSPLEALAEAADETL